MQSLAPLHPELPRKENEAEAVCENEQHPKDDPDDPHIVPTSRSAGGLCPFVLEAVFGLEVCQCDYGKPQDNMDVILEWSWSGLNWLHVVDESADA